MKNTIAALLIAFFTWGCGSGTTRSDNGILRIADEAPTGFTAAQSLETGEDHCKSPLVDTSDGTELILIRSTQGLGDYQVPEGKYGLEADELLRIDCNTGEVLGIVRQ